MSGSAVRAGGPAGLWFRFTQSPNEFLGLAHRELLADDGIEHAVLEFGRESADRTAVPLGQSTVGHRALDPGGKIEQTERVGHGRARPADARREGVLCEAEFVDQLAVRVGRLDRVEVLSLQVLDERELELVAIRQLAHQRRDPVEAGGLRRTEPPLTGDELIAVDRLGHEDGLEDAVLRDARGQRRETVGIEALARLMRVGLDARGRDLERPGLTGTPLRDQRGEAAAEALRAFRADRHDATASGDWDRSGSSWLSRARSSLVRAAYASAPVESGAYREIGWPWLGASDKRTLRGITVLKT